MHLRLLILAAITCTNYARARQAETVLDSTNLPLVVIHTNGGIIADEPKIKVDIRIIFNGPGVITSLQKNYITAFVNTFENKLYGSNFMDPIGGYL